MGLTHDHHTFGPGYLEAVTMDLATVPDQAGLQVTLTGTVGLDCGAHTHPVPVAYTGHVGMDDDPWEVAMDAFIHGDEDAAYELGWQMVNLATDGWTCPDADGEGT
jgi:hypothetical protein